MSRIYSQRSRANLAAVVQRRRCKIVLLLVAVSIKHGLSDLASGFCAPLRAVNTKQHPTPHNNATVHYNEVHVTPTPAIAALNLAILHLHVLRLSSPLTTVHNSLFSHRPSTKAVSAAKNCACSSFPPLHHTINFLSQADLCRANQQQQYYLHTPPIIHRRGSE